MNQPTAGQWYVYERSAKVLVIDHAGEPVATVGDIGYPMIDADAAFIVAACNACKAINPADPIAVAAALPNLVTQLRALLHVAVWDDDSDRAEFDAAYNGAVAALAALGTPF